MIVPAPLLEYIDVVLALFLFCLNYLCILRDEMIINAVQSTVELGLVARSALLWSVRGGRR